MSEYDEPISHLAEEKLAWQSRALKAEQKRDSWKQLYEIADARADEYCDKWAASEDALKACRTALNQVTARVADTEGTLRAIADMAEAALVRRDFQFCLGQIITAARSALEEAPK